MAATVKLLVWEVDNTLWDGVVSDSTEGALRPDAVRALRTLGERGVMHAVASRGEWDWTVANLRRHGLREHFAVVEVGWGRKSAAIARMAQTLGVGLDQVGYIDSEPLERSEVAHALPQVRAYAARHVDVLTALQEFRAPVGDVPPPTSPMGFQHIHAR
ncbi:HAD-IIIC family phosphatase [Nocardia sp. NPDC051030]|uniref:HAD-IIIC family phosphatase n=1 Tax=Nocardia sp. NPDC051030 TaxID=3155162 RepID=UPI003418883C